MTHKRFFVFFIFFAYLLSNNACCSATRTFVFTADASSAELAQWWVKRQKEQDPELHCVAVAHEAIEKEGATLYKHFTDYSNILYGPFQFLCSIPTFLRQKNELYSYISRNNFSDVVLVGCPFISLSLARKIKINHPEITITYISPPEMWLWGCWGIDWWLKKHCDHIVVIYPFEKDWYEQRGMHVEFYGYPYYDRFMNTVTLPKEKKHQIALFPGSRMSEIKELLPIFALVVRRLHNKFSDLTFVIPIAESIDSSFVIKILEDHGADQYVQLLDIKNTQTYQEIASSCLAITKPGTNILHLSMLEIPHIIAYKTSPFTFYFYYCLYLCRLIFQRDCVGLSNLILGEKVFPELLQSDCTDYAITYQAEKLYNQFLRNDPAYQNMVERLKEVKRRLSTSREEEVEFACI